MRGDQHRYKQRVQYSTNSAEVGRTVVGGGKNLNGFPIPTPNESVPMAHLFSNRLSGSEVADDLHGLTTLMPGNKVLGLASRGEESVLCFWLEDQLEKLTGKAESAIRCGWLTYQSRSINLWLCYRAIGGYG
jgi:hypothetical protein